MPMPVDEPDKDDPITSKLPYVQSKILAITRKCRKTTPRKKSLDKTYQIFHVLDEVKKLS